MRPLLVLFLSILLTVSAYAQTELSDLFKQGRLAEASAALDRTLASGRINIEMVEAWTCLHSRDGAPGDSLLAFGVAVENLYDKALSHAALTLYRGHTDLAHLGVLSPRVLVSLEENIDPYFADSMLILALPSQPDCFNFVRAYDILLGKVSPLKGLLRDRLGRGDFSAYPNLGRAMSSLVRGDLTDAHRIAIARAFLRDVPGDTYAWRYLADALYRTARYEAASAAYEASFEASPFLFSDNLKEAAQSYLRLGREGEAFSLLNRYCRLYLKGDSMDNMQLEKARLYGAVGDYGKAELWLKASYRTREIQDKAISERMYMETGLSWMKEARAYYLDLVQKGSKEATPYRTLIWAYNQDSAFSKSLELIHLEPDRVPEMDEGSYYQGESTYLGLKDYAGAVAWVRKWQAAYPASSWCLDNLTSMLRLDKEESEALVVLEQSVGFDGWSEWRIRQYFAIRETSGVPADRKYVMDSLLSRYPDNEDLWAGKSVLASSETAKLEVWDSAAARNPGSIFPFKYQRALYAGDRESLSRHLEELKERAPLIARDSFLLPQIDEEFVYTYLDLLKRNQITYEEAAQARKYMEAYERDGGNVGAMLPSLADIFAALNLKDSARLTLEKATLYQPDNAHVFWSLWTDYNDDNKGLLYRNYAERNPFESDRLYNYVKLNTMWTGSPIEAVKYASLFTQRFPNSGDLSAMATFRAQSLSFLGDNRNDYEVRYKNNWGLPTSERYVDWFTGSCLSALGGNNKVVVDSADCSAHIYFEDGTEARYQDNCDCGKVAMIKVGPSSVSFDYNVRCNLSRIRSSDGFDLHLDYDSLDHITRISSKKDGSVQFTYNAKGKPIRFTTSSRDTLRVTYNDTTGEVEKVESNQGREASERVTTLLTELEEKARIPGEALKSIARGDLPDLGMPDRVHDSLQDKYDEAVAGSAAWLRSGLVLVQYLYTHIQDKRDYGTRAAETCAMLFLRTRKKTVLYPQVLTVVDDFYNALTYIRQRGVASEYWDVWVQMQEWLEGVMITQKDNAAIFSAAVKMMDKYRDKPVVLLKDSWWLSKSDFQNRGFYREIPFSDILPFPDNGAVTFHKIFTGPLGQIYLTSNRGLFMERNGLWRYLTYRPGKERFVRSLELQPASGASVINDMAFSGDTILYIATDDGLFQVSGTDPENDKVTRIDDISGLSSGRINGLLGMNSLVLVAGDKGIDAWDPRQGRVLHTYLKGRDIAFIRQGEDHLVAGVADQAFFTALVPDSGDDRSLDFSEVYTGNFDQVYFSDGRPVYSVGNKVTYLERDNVSGKSYSEDLTGNIVSNKKVYGIVDINVEGDPVMSVLTDRGISFYRDRHFEHLDIPSADGKLLSVQDVAYAGGGGLDLLCGDRLVLFEKNRVSYAYNKKATSMLTLDSMGMTLVADGGILQYYDTAGGGLRDFPTNSTIDLLAKESDTSFIASSGNDIYRYSIDRTTLSPTETLLFTCEQTPSPEGEYKVETPIRNILVDRKGRVWAAGGLSVFKYDPKIRDADSLVEYNFFKDPVTFPSYTELVYRVLETLDGRIWVVCSDERHLSYKGMALTGGLLEWREDKKAFVNLTPADETKRNGMAFNWFINSYTPVSADRAIVGTSTGFQEDYLGDFHALSASENESVTLRNAYATLKSDHPSLFLGTQGTKIGDCWLFGSPSGVVAYINGIWLYPEKLNQLLPRDMEFREYGGRWVKAISYNPSGHLFVATNLGLLDYNLGSNDPLSFLTRAADPQELISYFNQGALESERTAIIGSIPEESEPGRLLKAYAQAGEDLRKVRAKKGESRKRDMVGANNRVALDSLTLVESEATRNQMKMLSQIEQNYPSLSQLVHISPIELATSRSRLKGNECILQYIPMGGSLGIQFVSQGRVSFKEVRISQEALMDSVGMAVAYLRHNGSDTVRGGTVVSTGPPDKAPLQSLLHYLYDVLVGPVSGDIRGFDHLYIIPAGRLFYLPFSCLSHVGDDGQDHYLAEDCNVGYLSTMYLYDLVYNFKSTGRGSTYLFADPDGSLPYALQETDSIRANVSHSQVFSGTNASVKNLLSVAEKCKVLHLATHGHLSTGKIDESWILFSDKKLTMDQLLVMKLPNTDMAVLSTCESALGVDGIEYATLARAFSAAGVPTVVSSLWAISDRATKEIMIHFYQNYTGGMDTFTALSTAQRSYLAAHREDGKNDPYYWAPFIVLGKP